jgi:hypothetical protein
MSEMTRGHFDFRGPLDRQLARLFASENASSVNASQTVRVGNASAIAHQAAGGDELASFENRRHAVAERQRGELFPPFRETRARAYD